MTESAVIERPRNELAPNQPLHCSWAKHLKYHKCSPTALLLYIRAGELTSGGKNLYNCKLTRMSEAILSNEVTIMHAAKELCTVGVLEVVSRRRKHPTEYRFVQHKDYAATHPEECHLCLEEGRRRELGPEFEHLGAKREKTAHSEGRARQKQTSGKSANEKQLPPYTRDAIITRLTQEWASEMDGEITFLDKDRTRLSTLLLEFTEQELREAFQQWSENWYGDNRFAGSNFAQTADQFCYTVRKHAQEKVSEVVEGITGLPGNEVCFTDEHRSQLLDL